jgi:hypothetical protein
MDVTINVQVKRGRDRIEFKTNAIYCGDCKNILAQFPSRKEMKGIMIAFSFTSDAYEEVSRAKFENEIQIELKTVKEILEEE